MSNIFTKRLTKELRDLQANPPAGILIDKADDDLKLWKVVMSGAEGTLYQGEQFKLQFKFSNNYPLESPEVIFLDTVPIHPHIYSNGHICLSILYDQWSPALTISSVCLSIQSMLSSATKKERPPDNAMYIMTAKKSPKATTWAFHVLSLLVAHANALYFYLEGSKQRCFYEELPGETTVVGNYKSEELVESSGGREYRPNTERGLQINVEQADNHHRVLTLRGDHAGKFVFSTAEAGEYSICMFTVSTGWFASSTSTRLHLDMMFGEATHDTQPNAKKETLSDLALLIRELNVKVSNVRREQLYQKEREASFRDTSEKANAHIRNWTIAQLVVMVATCAWQITHLKGFFVAKKLV
ncbi:ubiquitin-conjugating enzyme E2 W [Geranomyces variabilis]|nr:ubiquitin-conjugating enzyme E2 W [Geranomyces variabilis]